MEVTFSSNGSPLVVLPGLLCDSRMFGGLLAHFSHARVVDGFYGGARSIEAMAEFALAQLPERVCLLGHSMGARVALEMLRREPARIERLALVDTGVHPVRAGETEKRYALAELGREHGMAALVDAWLPPMLSPAAQEDQQLLECLKAMCVSAGIEIYEAQIAALLSRPELDSLLPTIRCPTFAIVGSADQWSPPAQHEAIVAAIPGARLRVVEGAGHMLPAETPELFNLVIDEWLGAETD